MHNLSALQSDPYLDRGMRGCIFNMARKHYRKISGYEVDDLVQEGLLVYCKCKMRYVGQPPERRRDGSLRRPIPLTNPDNVARKHFMTIFKRSFWNHIQTLMQKQSASKEIPITNALIGTQSEIQFLEQHMDIEEEALSAAVLLKTASREIKELFNLLVNDALELSGARRLVGRGDWFVEEAHKLKPGRRGTANERYCRLLGLPPGTDLVGQVEQHFLGT